MNHTKFAFSTNFFVVSFLLVACTSQASTPTPTGEPMAAINTVVSTPVPPTATQPMPTPVPSATFTPTPTDTPTVTPTLLPTATATPPAIPTPPGADVLEQVLWLYETNNGCQLPCWWGIVPGETTWDVAEQFLELFDSNISFASNPGIINYSPEIPLPSQIFNAVSTLPIYSVRNGVVHGILTDVAVGDKTPPGYLSAYILSTFLATYGQPAEIRLFTYRAPFEENDLPFFVLLIYPEQGIIAMYDDNGQLLGDVVQGCPQKNLTSLLKLWASDSDLTVEQIIEGSSALRRDYRSLEEATGMDVATFYETFRHPENTTCLQTPADLWR